MSKKIILSLTFSIFCSQSLSSEIENLFLSGGFKINIYAEDLKSARQIAESPNGAIFAGSKSDGSLLISDDKYNVIYRVTYAKEKI